jgi:hypothetical protein
MISLYVKLFNQPIMLFDLTASLKVTHGGKGRIWFILSTTAEYAFCHSQQQVQKDAVFIRNLLEGLLRHKNTKDDFVDRRPA